jgi:hypothetical protein
MAALVVGSGQRGVTVVVAVTVSLVVVVGATVVVVRFTTFGFAVVRRVVVAPLC